MILLHSFCSISKLDPVVGDELPPREAGDEGSIWCFAFGSNLCSSVLSGRRMIKPAESVPGILHGYKLSFNQPGLPYREPGFATVDPIDSNDGEDIPEVHGVAYLMTTSQWNYYLESEGAAGQSDKGYGVIQVTIHAYDGREIKACTLRTQPKTVAYLKGRVALPSKRYLNLIRQGAEEQKLSQEYREYLDSLSHYAPPGIGGHIGAFITAFIAFGLLFPMFGMMRLLRKLRGIDSTKSCGLLQRFQSMFFHFVFGFSWLLHDILRPILGCGCSNPASPRVKVE